jgi:hypothetical protein
MSNPYYNSLTDCKIVPNELSEDYMILRAYRMHRTTVPLCTGFEVYPKVTCAAIMRKGGSELS